MISTHVGTAAIVEAYGKCHMRMLLVQPYTRPASRVKRLEMGKCRLTFRRMTQR